MVKSIQHQSVVLYILSLLLNKEVKDKVKGRICITCRRKRQLNKQGKENEKMCIKQKNVGARKDIWHIYMPKRTL